MENLFKDWDRLVRNRVASLGNYQEHCIELYGDHLFDLCHSLFLNADQAQEVFHSILKKIKASSRLQEYLKFEKSWVFKLAFQQIISEYHRSQTQDELHSNFQLKQKVSSEHVSQKISAENILRLQRFSHYFNRIAIKDRFLLILKDKYEFPFPEISTAMGEPEGTLKVRRQQALRMLEDLIWSNSENEYELF